MFGFFKKEVMVFNSIEAELLHHLNKGRVQDRFIINSTSNNGGLLIDIKSKWIKHVQLYIKDGRARFVGGVTKTDLIDGCENEIHVISSELSVQNAAKVILQHSSRSFEITSDIENTTATLIHRMESMTSEDVVFGGIKAKADPLSQHAFLVRYFMVGDKKIKIKESNFDRGSFMFQHNRFGGMAQLEKQLRKFLC